MFDLPQVTPYTLNRAPLAQALAQVRFPLQARLASLEGLAGLQDRLSDPYPYLAPAATGPVFELQLGPNGPQPVNTQSEFVFRSDDGHAVWVSPNRVTLSVGPEYAGAADFTARLNEVLNALHVAVRIPRFERVAARYLTLAPVPLGDDYAWSRWFKPELTGWTGAGLISEQTTVVSALNQVQLRSRPQGDFADFPGEVGGVVRHGLVPPGSNVDGIPPVQVGEQSYVIDLDLYCEAAQPWEPERIGLQFSALHEKIDQFFRWTLLPEGEAHFELEERGR